jgi:hypothetical protein
MPFRGLFGKGQIKTNEMSSDRSRVLDSGREAILPGLGRIVLDLGTIVLAPKTIVSDSGRIGAGAKTILPDLGTNCIRAKTIDLDAAQFAQELRQLDYALRHWRKSDISFAQRLGESTRTRHDPHRGN